MKRFVNIRQRLIVKECLTGYSGLTCATVVCPYPLSVVAGAALHNVVSVI